MITGRTKLIVHLGYPTESFKAPMIYNPWFEMKGLDVVVVPVGVEPPNYPDLLKALFRTTNVHGALVTMPHKVTNDPPGGRDDNDRKNRGRLQRDPASA